MARFLDRLFGPRRATPEDVGRYYDDWTNRYLASAGDVIQAYRPADTEELLSYYIAAAGLVRGSRVLDAGCGVGGPAIHFARHAGVVVDGITASGVQAEKACAAVAAAGLASRVRIVQGDYHTLDRHYAPSSFDTAIFLESLGHSSDPSAAVRSAATALKTGGALYVKDFYARESDDAEERRRIAAVVANIDRIYAYNTLDLHTVIAAVRRAGLEIDFVRRLGFASDVAARAEFERVNAIDIFGGMTPFVAADWLELRATKPS